MDRYLLPTHPPGFLDVISDDIKEDDEKYKLTMLRSFESSEQGEDGLNGRVLIMEGKQSINEENTFPMRLQPEMLFKVAALAVLIFGQGIPYMATKNPCDFKYRTDRTGARVIPAGKEGCRFGPGRRFGTLPPSRTDRTGVRVLPAGKEWRRFAPSSPEFTMKTILTDLDG